MNTESELVFVYGTLRRGASNHGHMDGSSHISHANAKGHLYQVDWYPGLVIDPQGHEVAGEVYSVPSEMMDDLDQYEGPEYKRIKGTVTNCAGESLDVWIWEWKKPTDGLKKIPNGDWLLAESC